MTPDEKGIEFIKSREGLKLQAYQDSKGIWTIGYGTIVYETGRPVKKGDTITQGRADALLLKDIEQRAVKVAAAVKDVTVNQNQYNALLSFAYNVGIGALLSSTLLKRVLANPNDPTIRDAFMMWNKVFDNKTQKYIPVTGLTTRRAAEADLYFS